MKCVICKHWTTREGTATITVVRESMTLVVKNIPAQVCETCGEEYIDEMALARLRKLLSEPGESEETGEKRMEPC